jgi:hypothetical protein
VLVGHVAVKESIVKRVIGTSLNECYSCKMTYGKWIKVSSEEVEKLYGKEKHKLD